MCKLDAGLARNFGPADDCGVSVSSMLQDRPRIAAVIPARIASSRFPEKLLADLQGHPVLAWTIAQVKKAKNIDSIHLATDAVQLAELAEKQGIQAHMTGEAASGSDRIAAIIPDLDADVVINVQGDEPAIAPSTIDAVAEPFLSWQDAPMVTTAAFVSHEPEEYNNPNVVKIICDLEGDALYFSRAPLPYARDGVPTSVLCHHGIYGYWTDLLQRFARWPASPLEEIEKLEQLRLLEHGISIRVVQVQDRSIGVDTPEDLNRVTPFLAPELME